MTTPIQQGDVLLGKYAVERVLGQGGMGLVVAARHVDLGELFAIKRLIPSALDTPAALERFLREARVAARLKNEHVVRVHDVGRLEDGSPYMVMEHLEGRDLKAILNERGPLPAEEATTLLLQACEALAEAHEKGIVHRDLKPANLFITTLRSGAPCVKVLDFGIAKPTEVAGDGLTGSGIILGTPSYMSPEQITGDIPTDTRTDVWALGVVLYELVTGKKPFGGGSVGSVFSRMMERPTPPSHLVGAVPPWVDAIVARCLQKLPEDRFQSVDELSIELLRAAFGREAALSSAPSGESAAMSSQGTGGERASAPGHHGTVTLTRDPPLAPAPSNTLSQISVAKSANSVNPPTHTAARAGRGGLVAALVLAATVIGVAAVGIVWRLSSAPSAASISLPATEAAPPRAPIAPSTEVAAPAPSAAPTTAEIAASAASQAPPAPPKKPGTTKPKAPGDTAKPTKHEPMY